MNLMIRMCQSLCSRQGVHRATPVSSAELTVSLINCCSYTGSVCLFPIHLPSRSRILKHTRTLTFLKGNDHKNLFSSQSVDLTCTEKAGNSVLNHFLKRESWMFVWTRSSFCYRLLSFCVAHNIISSFILEATTIWLIAVFEAFVWGSSAWMIWPNVANM